MREHLRYVVFITLMSTVSRRNQVPHFILPFITRCPRTFLPHFLSRFLPVVTSASRTPAFYHSLPVTGVPEHATNYCLVPTVCIWALRIHFMLINSPGRSTCLISWYGLLIMVGCVGGDFSQTQIFLVSFSIISKRHGSMSKRNIT